MKNKFLILFSFFILISIQANAQTPYSDCYAKDRFKRDEIMIRFHKYSHELDRDGKIIKDMDTVNFDKAQFDLFINNFLYWGGTGSIDINTDPFFKYYDSMIKTLYYYDRLEFGARPEIVEKLKQRKQDSFYLAGPEVFTIPDSVAKKTRFGNLAIGKSLDLYYMKPLVVFFDTAWEQSITFDYGDGVSPYPRGHRSFCECKDDPLKSPKNGEFYPSAYGQFDDCQYEMFKYRLAGVYDILAEDMERIAVKGKDMRYNMFRRIKITREYCYYTVHFYQDIFEPDTQTQMLRWYINKYKKKKNDFIPNWEEGFELKTTLTTTPMSHPDLCTSWLKFYSHKLCFLEEGKIGKKAIHLSKKFQETPNLSNLWNDGVFMDTWQIMDFGDNKPVCRRFTADGDLILYRNPLNAYYYSIANNYHYVGNDARPFYKSYSKKRRFLYYSILRYPYYSIRHRIHTVTHE